MSTSTTSSEARPTVVSGATTADAQLIVQILAAGAVAGADRGAEILYAYATPPTLHQLRIDYPRLGEEYRQVMLSLGQMEIIATFVKQGVLNEVLIHDLLWVSGAWKFAKQICLDMRAEASEPRLYENFEWLAARAT